MWICGEAPTFRDMEASLRGSVVRMLHHRKIQTRLFFAELLERAIMHVVTIVCVIVAGRCDQRFQRDSTCAHSVGGHGCIGMVDEWMYVVICDRDV
jgi:hypothetical protein